MSAPGVEVWALTTQAARRVEVQAVVASQAPQRLVNKLPGATLGLDSVDDYLRHSGLALGQLPRLSGWSHVRYRLGLAGEAPGPSGNSADVVAAAAVLLEWIRWHLPTGSEGLIPAQPSPTARFIVAGTGELRHDPGTAAIGFDGSQIAAVSDKLDLLAKELAALRGAPDAPEVRVLVVVGAGLDPTQHKPGWDALVKAVGPHRIDWVEVRDAPDLLHALRRTVEAAWTDWHCKAQRAELDTFAEALAASWAEVGERVAEYQRELWALELLARRRSHLWYEHGAPPRLVAPAPHGWFLVSDGALRGEGGAMASLPGEYAPQDVESVHPIGVPGGPPAWLVRAGPFGTKLHLLEGGHPAPRWDASPLDCPDGVVSFHRGGQFLVGVGSTGLLWDLHSSDPAPLLLRAGPGLAASGHGKFDRILGCVGRPDGYLFWGWDEQGVWRVDVDTRRRLAGLDRVALPGTSEPVLRGVLHADRSGERFALLHGRAGVPTALSVWAVDACMEAPAVTLRSTHDLPDPASTRVEWRLVWLGVNDLLLVESPVGASTGVRLHRLKVGAEGGFVSSGGPAALTRPIQQVCMDGDGRRLLLLEEPDERGEACSWIVDLGRGGVNDGPRVRTRPLRRSVAVACLPAGQLGLFPEEADEVDERAAFGVGGASAPPSQRALVTQWMSGGPLEREVVRGFTDGGAAGGVAALVSRAYQQNEPGLVELLQAEVAQRSSALQACVRGPTGGGADESRLGDWVTRMNCPATSPEAPELAPFRSERTAAGFIRSDPALEDEEAKAMAEARERAPHGAPFDWKENPKVAPTLAQRIERARRDLRRLGFLLE